jgi:hypothetical protein
LRLPHAGGNRFATIVPPLLARYGSTQDLGHSLESLWLPLPLETRQGMGSISAIVVHEGEAEKRSIEGPCVEARLHGQWTRVKGVHVVDHYNLVGVEGETAPRPRPVEAAISMELYRTLLP